MSIDIRLFNITTKLKDRFLGFCTIIYLPKVRLNKPFWRFSFDFILGRQAKSTPEKGSKSKDSYLEFVIAGPENKYGIRIAISLDKLIR